MKVEKLLKSLLASFLFLTLLNANNMIDKDMIPNHNKKSMKSKLPLDYGKNEDLAEDIKYNNINVKRENEYKIFDVDGDFGYVSIPNQKIGQSGIIVNKSSSTIIIGTGIVVSSDDEKTKLEFKGFDGLTQEAIPNTNVKVSNGDFFILDYLYKASTIIAPNSESFYVLRNILPEYNFLHPDMLGAFFKVQEEPLPSEESIKKFALEQNLGSIFIVIEDKAYQLDSRTFKVVNIINIKYEDKKQMKPFYTRVEKIEQGTFDFDEEEIEDYTKYYKELLDIK